MKRKLQMGFPEFLLTVIFKHFFKIGRLILLTHDRLLRFFGLGYKLLHLYRDSQFNWTEVLILTVFLEGTVI